MFNPAMFGGVAKSAKFKQDLKASQAPVPEVKEVIIQWHGSPWDGMRATIGAQVPGQTIVVLADGRKVSVPPTNLVAAPKTEKKDEKKDEKKEDTTEKSKKVVPGDKPDTRGDAAQAEDTTDRAKKNSTEKQAPPVLEHMKKGPKSVPVETARTAPEAAGALPTLIAAAEAAEAATKEASTAAQAAQAKVGAAKAEEAKAIQLVIDEMEKTNTVVAKVKDRLVALDSEKKVAAVNIPKTGSLRVRYDASLAALKSIQAQATEQAASIKELEAEAEEQYGATYNVKKRVSLFPASLQAVLKTAASFSDLIKGISDWVKSLFGLAEDAEKAVDALIEELDGGTVEAASNVPRGTLASALEPAPAKLEVIDAFVAANAQKAIDFMKKEQQEAVAEGKAWDGGEADATLFEYLSEAWADGQALPAGEEDHDEFFDAFDVAFERIAKMAREQGLIFETMKFPVLEASKATRASAEDFIGGEIEHLIKDKGFGQDRAKGAAYNIARRKGYKVGQKKTEASLSQRRECDTCEEFFDVDPANPKQATCFPCIDKEKEKGAAPEPEAVGFKAFQDSLRRRTGLTAADAGIIDLKAFAGLVASKGHGEWITAFIKKHGLRDLVAKASK